MKQRVNKSGDASYTSLGAGESETLGPPRNNPRISEISISCFSHPDGVVYPLLNGLDDQLLDKLFRDGQLTGVPIDELIRQSFVLLMNEPVDHQLGELAGLKRRLSAAIRAVLQYETSLAERVPQAAH